MTPIKTLLAFLKSTECPQHSKDELTRALVERFKLTKDRKVYYCQNFAIRFSSTRGRSFSNTILSLSHLQKFDHIPFLVVLSSSSEENRVFIANTTFLKKISHSSHELRIDNIKGSFNGSDIAKSFIEIPNDIDHVEDLFAYHIEKTWQENLERLVEATNNITTTSSRFSPTEQQMANIANSIRRAADFVVSSDYTTLLEDLNDRTERVKDCIYIASRIENVNIRGRLIEALVTANHDERESLCRSLQEEERKLPVYDTKNGLGDYHRLFLNTDTYTDIKTKIVYLDSNPKAFNVDKFLECMAKDDSVFLFYFIGINESGIMKTVLCSVYHKEIVDNMKVQFHWSGRNTRGVTQLIGKKVNEILQKDVFTNEIQESQAFSFLQTLMNS